MAEQSERNQISRRSFLKGTGLVGLGVLGSQELLEAAEPKPKRRPNVVFILADQWRASATGYGGDPTVKTPNLDRLAAESFDFRTAVSVCPVCTPYRAALLTGRYPTSTGMFMNDLGLPDDEFCMAEMFGQAGYDTAYIGKWHLDGRGRSAYIPPERRQGFDYWKVAECDHNYQHSHYYTGTSSEMKHWEGYDTFAQTRDARQYLRDHSKADSPFLLFVGYGTPHFPHHTAPEEYKAMYPVKKITLPPNVPKDLQEVARKEARGYYAHCTAIDKCVGNIMRTLEETGLAENTILVFTSDHGEMLGSQGFAPFFKQVPYDESVRVPFLLRYPAGLGRKGSVVKSPIGTVEILPTLLDLAGVAIPSSIEGDSVAQIIREKRLDEDRTVLYMLPSPFSNAFSELPYRAIRTNRHTYVRYIDGPTLLFDDGQDPHQMQNLAGHPGSGALQKRLETRLHAMLRNIDDDLRPRQYYLDKWGYTVDAVGDIPFSPGSKPQWPGMKK